MAAILALVDMAPHAFGAAGGYIGQRPFVTGEHTCTELLQIAFAMASNDLSQGDHGYRSAISSLRLLPNLPVSISVMWV